MLKKLALALLGAAAIASILSAADFWLKKPYTEWTDEEARKIFTNSPWAWQKSLDSGGAGPSQQVTIVWQSALPVKRAMYSKPALTNPQAKALLERVETVHMLRMAGVPGSYREKADVEKIKMATVLKIKGHEPIHPDQIQIPQAAPPKGFGGPGKGKGGPPKGNNFQNNFQRGGGGGGRGFGGDGDTPPPGGGGGFSFAPPFDVYFVFPKSIDLKVEDQEMEFDTNVGGFSLKHKFKLKDMVYDGNLEI